MSAVSEEVERVTRRQTHVIEIIELGLEYLLVRTSCAAKERHTEETERVAGWAARVAEREVSE